MKFFYITTVFLLLTLSQNAHSQKAMTTEELVEAWDIMTTMVVESAKKMPSEYYSFTPYESLRNFADQINHTTMSNFMFARIVDAGQPVFSLPDRNNPPQDKEEVIEILEKSFEHFRQGLASLEEDSFTDKMAWGPATNRREIPRIREMCIRDRNITGITALNHIHRHLLQLAKSYLAQTELSVKEIAYALYFESPSTFSSFFKKNTGTTPLSYRQQIIL